LVWDRQAGIHGERLQGYAETNVEPGRRFANEVDFQDRFDAWIAKVNARTHKTLTARATEQSAKTSPTATSLPVWMTRSRPLVGPRAIALRDEEPREVGAGAMVGRMGGGSTKRRPPGRRHPRKPALSRARATALPFSHSPCGQRRRLRQPTRGYLSGSGLPQLWIRVNVVPHLPGSANSLSASRRSRASSSSLSLSSSRDSSATLN
jgi:hypothetical protein